MKKKPYKSKTKPKTGDFVIVTFAEDMEQAREYEALLKSDDIPVRIQDNTDDDAEGPKTLALMVPEEYLDEAHVVIESQNAYDDFYDFTTDDDDEGLGSEYFDENF